MTNQKYLWLQLTMVFVTFIFCACNRQAKLARKCAELFPIKDSIQVIDRVELDTFMFPDTYIEYVDTTICPPGTDSLVIIKPVTKRVPGKTIVKEKVYRDTIIIRESTAKLTVLNNQIDSLRKVNSKIEKKLLKNKGANRALMICFAVILAFLGLFLYIKTK